MTYQCQHCGEVKLISEFYHRKDGSHSKWCKACYRARAREYNSRVYSTPEGRAKLLAQQAKYRAEHREELLARQAKYRAEHREELLARQAKYRAEHREELKEAKRLRRRKAGIMPKRRLDRQKILKMYADGIPVPDIAKACNASEHTVRKYASKAHVRRERYDRAKVCRNCWKYPCFKGIENFETNFALTCRSWHLRGKS